MEFNFIEPNEIIKNNQQQFDTRLKVIELLFKVVLTDEKLQMITTPEELQLYFNCDTNAEIDVFDIAKKLNINCKSCSNTYLSGYMSANFETEELTIYYKRSDTKERQRFTIAHELGHLFVHFQFGKALDRVEFTNEAILDEYKFSNSPEYKHSNQDYLLRARSNDMSDKFEREAHKFAQNLLVPKIYIEKHNDNIYGLMKHFNVSQRVIQYALADLKYERKNYV